MRYLWLTIPFVLTTCDSTSGVDQCMKMPPPPACAQSCDPAAMNNPCPVGFHCESLTHHCGAECTQGGNECAQGDRCTVDGRCVSGNTCTGLDCQVVNCSKMGMPPTTLSGTVFAP